MKNLMLILALIGITAASPTAAERDKAQKDLEEQIAHDMALEWMKQGKFVLMAQTVNTPYGVDTDPNPREAFVSLEDGTGHFQIHSAGEVFEGKASGITWKDKKNGNFNMEFRIDDAGRTAKVYVEMKKDSNRGTATIIVEDNMMNRSQASFVGHIYPINSTPLPLIKGFTKPRMGKWMDPFAPFN